MKKVLIMAAHECRHQLRRPAFWLLSVLVPLVVAVLYALPFVAASSAQAPTTVWVVDQTGLFSGGLMSTDRVHFRQAPDVNFADKHLNDTDGESAILFVPMRETTIPRDAFLYYRGTAPSVEVQSIVDSRLQQLLRDALIEDVYGLDPQAVHSVQSTHINLRIKDMATGHESHAAHKTRLAVLLAVLIATCIVVFTTQTARSLQSERHNRLVEVMGSSVRPIAIVGGKVIGVALTAVLQTVVWLLLAWGGMSAVRCANADIWAQAEQTQVASAIASKGDAMAMQMSMPNAVVDEALQGLAATNLGLVACMFVGCFLVGLLLYGAIIAAVAAKLDPTADSLQWTLLSASPLLAAALLSTTVASAPSSTLAAVLTFLPLTSPVALLQRVPFGLPVWQVVVAMGGVLLFAALMLLWASAVYGRNVLQNK
ncbi:MAG: ABC transporter permease [Bacteroidales bacterium]|nr:ABC transporter permease [Bacteroidales bacterium]